MTWRDYFPSGLFGTGQAKLTEPETVSSDRVRVISRGNASGKVVTPNTALQLSTAWSCVRLLSETIGTLPLGTFTKDGAGNKMAAREHDLYPLLHDEPNADQTACEFWESIVAGLCLWGNGYAEKTAMQSTGRITALSPFPGGHGSVTVYRDRDTNARRYRFPDRGKMEELPEEKVFHVRGFGVGADQGLSPIGFARQTLGAALAAEEVAAGMFGSGLHLSGFIEQVEKAKTLTEEQMDQLVELFARFAGSPNAGRVMPLQPGMKFTALGMDPEDAQLLQTRAFHVEEICRWFRVPPFMVGHTEKSTSWGTGLEQQMIGFVTFTLAPYLKRIEQAIKKQLLPVAERGRVYAEFNLEALLRGDSAARAALYSSAGQNGWMDRNEIRAKENLPPRDGAGALTVQANLVPLDQLGADASPEQQIRSALLTLIGGDLTPMIDERMRLLAPPAPQEA
jgi:HK97 family phage portal protein